MSNSNQLKEVLVCSTKRSSHHAFIEGLVKDRRVKYLNNCVVTQNGLVPGEVVDGLEGSEPGEERDVFLVSFERNFRLPDILSNKVVEASFSDFKEAKKIIFLRDPINTASSTFSVHEKGKSNPLFADPKFVVSNLEHFSSMADYVSSSEFSDDGFIFVYANRFWEDEQYRLSVLKIIGFEGSSFTSNMSYFGGGGNSFFGNKKEVLPSALNSRYLRYADNDYFLSFIREEKFVAAARKFIAYVDDAALGKAFDKLVGFGSK